MADRGHARAALLLLVGAAASGQSAIELARKAPPELFADAVIKLVEHGELPASSLTEAFEAAKQAREPVRLLAMPQLADRRPGLREAAGKAGLDALSLEARIVSLLAATDADKARELFQSVEHPRIEARPCEDPMIADVSAYYEMGAKVPGVSLIALIGPANSPGELASFAKLLRTAPSLMPDEFRLLLGALALKMELIPPDYRSFTMTAEELRAELDALAARARELGVPVEGLAEGARKLAVKQLSSPRCHEEFGEAMRFVDWFNRTYGKRFDPIGEDETIAKGALGWAKADGYFDAGSGKQLAQDFQQLRTTVGKPEWGKKLAEFLSEFEEWKPSAGPPVSSIDAFHQKMTVLHGLYQLIPPGEDRDKLAARAIEFLKGNEVERQYPAEWLFQVSSFAGSALNGKAKLLDGFRESGDAGLVLFERLNR